MTAMRAAKVLLLLLGATGVAHGAKPTQRLSDAARGEQLYTRHCASCHGVDAAGDGPVAGALLAPVPDLRDRVTDSHQREHVDVILAGRGFMPAFSLSFDRYDARRVWRHLQRAASGELGSVPDEDAAEDRADPDSDTDPRGIVEQE